MLSTARTAHAEALRGRTTTVRPLTKLLSNSANEDTATALRLQRLRLIGIIGQRAALLAQIAWEVAA
jgi:hypothetical protein